MTQVTDSNVLVSIIIPIFQGEKYLGECIDSIQQQDYKQMEVILIDDGSSDDTPELCDYLAKKYSNIVVSHRDRVGISAARNIGLNLAKGKYVIFVDADDMLIERHTVSRLVQAIKKSDSDIVTGNYHRIWDGEQLQANRNQLCNDTDRNSRDFRYEGFFTGGILSYVWAKIYRREFLQTNRIEFRELEYAEDKMFNFECYLADATYHFLEDDVYIYRKNTQSVSNQYRSDACSSWMEIAETLDAICEHKHKSEYEDMVAYTIFFAVFFDSKMEYEHKGRCLAAIKQMLLSYMQYPLTVKMFGNLARFKFLQGIHSISWKCMMWSFSLAMRCHMYTLISIGLKLLIECKIDQRLSSTGKARYNNRDD